MAAETTRSEAAVLDVVEAQRQEVRQSASADIEKVEDRRDRELRRLDQVAAVFGNGRISVAGKEASTTQSGPKPSRPRRRRQKKRRSVAVEARERREAIYRYLLEQAGPVAKGEIRQALRISDFSTSSALKWLAQEGRVKRTGIGSATRYQAKAGPPPGSGLAQSALSSRAQGSSQGRILTMLEDRGSASLSELAQALRAPLEQVRKECGALIREEEICMARRDGQPVYALERAAA